MKRYPTTWIALFLAVLFFPFQGKSENEYDRLATLSLKYQYFAANHMDSAEVLFPEVYALGVRLDDGKTVGDILSFRSVYELYEGNTDSSRVYATWALQIYKNLKNPRLVGESYITLSNLLLEMRWDREAKAYADSANTIAEVLDDSDLKVRSLFAKANILIHSNLFYDAQPLLVDAIKAAKGIEDKSLQAILYSSLASCFNNQGRLDSAISMYQQAIELYPDDKTDLNKAIAYLNITTVFIKTGDFQKAEEYLNEANYIFQATNFRPGEADVLLKRGMIAKKANKDYVLADSLINRAIQIYSDTEEIEYKLQAQVQLASSYIDQKLFEQAESTLVNVLDEAKRFGQGAEILEASLTMGELMLTLDRVDEAIMYLEAAAQQQVIFQQDEMLMKINKPLSEAYSLKGDYKKAHKYLLAYHELRDRQLQMMREIAQAEAEARFYTNKKSRENLELRQKEMKAKASMEKKDRLMLIALGALGFIILIVIMIFTKNRKIQKQKKALQKANKKVATQNEQLEELNEMKDRLFSIISHDLRSPLNNLYEFISLLETQDLTKDEIDMLVPKLKERYQYVSSLIDNLLHWARLQVSDTVVKPAKVKVYSQVSETLNLLQPQAEQKKVSLLNFVKKDHDMWADENAVQLIVRNFVSNALKYSKMGSEIEVNSTISGDEIIVSVKDSGVGIPKAKLPELFTSFGKSTKGTRNEKGTGVGLSICKEYAEKNKGRVWAESTEGVGSTFFFAMPRATQEVMMPA